MQAGRSQPDELVPKSWQGARQDQRRRARLLPKETKVHWKGGPGTGEGGAGTHAGETMSVCGGRGGGGGVSAVGTVLLWKGGGRVAGGAVSCACGKNLWGDPRSPQGMGSQIEGREQNRPSGRSWHDAGIKSP